MRKCKIHNIRSNSTYFNVILVRIITSPWYHYPSVSGCGQLITYSRVQIAPRGGEQAVKVGGLRFLLITIVWHGLLAHSHLGGSGGMLPRKFWKFRLSENVSEAFWQSFLEPTSHKVSSIIIVLIWVFGNMRGLSPPPISPPLAPMNDHFLLWYHRF